MPHLVCGQEMYLTYNFHLCSTQSVSPDAWLAWTLSCLFGSAFGASCILNIFSMFYCQVICQVYNLLTISPALGWPQIWLYFTMPYAVTASGQTLVYMWLHDLQDEWHDEGSLRAELAIRLHCPLGQALGIEAVLPVGLATEIRSF